jgi:uncharacterized membrane protein
MSMFGNAGRRIADGLAIVTDWLLIVMGLLLVVIALKSIDVQVAEYVVIGGGVLLSGIGFWYRFRRLKRYKKQAE